LPYREKQDVESGTGSLVTVRTYLDPVQAQLACTHLRAQGIEAHVFEATSYHPMLSGAAGGTRLQVREGDLVRADALLTEHPGEDEGRDDGEGSGVVRCPRCELAYCSYGSVPRGSGGWSAPALLMAAFLPKRWHCEKCGHAWNDPKEGPTAMTPLGPDDPRPVFRLRRDHKGMGLFLGVMSGMLAGLVTGLLPRELAWLGAVFFMAAPVVGWAVGKSMKYDLCSDPACRTRLPPGREDCPRCNGAIAGVVLSAGDHYAAAADFRRELRALGERDEKRRMKKLAAGMKKKKKRAEG
jgi:hypothetical protein